MYKLLYHPSAAKRLKTIHPVDRKKVLSKIEVLSKNPHDSSLNVKKLVGTKSSYRLRVGNMRVIFEIEETNKRIYTKLKGNSDLLYIWEIEYRGSVSY